MAISALIGNPPATQNDLDIVKGIHAQAGMTLADPSKGVALSPAPSIIPSYANKGPAIIVGLIIAMIFIITITGGRILARYKYKAPTLGRDDALIVVGAAGAISWLGIAVAMVIQGGVGQHVYNLSYMDYYQFSRYRSIDAIVYPVTVSLIQMSILYFNWRLLGATSKVRLWTLPAFFVAIICYLLLALFLSIFTCSPVAAGFSLITYGRDAGNVKCLNARTTTSTIGVFHFALNWMLLEIPTTILFRSKISTVLKFRCIIPLSLGVLACISPIMRLYYQVHPSEDITFNWTNELNWTTVELVTLVCVTSLTAINSAILRHLPESIRKYWAPITQNTDEFGRRLNSNAPLIGNNDFALQPYPRAAPRTTTISHDTIAQAHVHSQGLGGDEDFLGYMGRLDRGRMDEQSAVNTSIRG